MQTSNEVTFGDVEDIKQALEEFKQRLAFNLACTSFDNYSQIHNLLYQNAYHNVAILLGSLELLCAIISIKNDEKDSW